MKRKYIFLAVIVLLVIAITSCEIADLLEGLGSNVYVATGAIKPTATSGAKIENLFKPDGFEDFDVEGLKNSLMEDLASPAKAAEIKEKMKTPLDEDTDIASFLPEKLKKLIKDVASLAPIVGLLIILVLLFSFRKLSGVILPLVGLVISAAISLGIMAIFNITVTMATMLVPVLLLIVGSAYAIHIMSHFYEEIVLFHGVINVQQTHQTISMVVKRNRIPIIMAGATTAAGFIAQFTSPLEPFRTFGLLSAIGVVLSQISSLYLLPALLRLTYSKPVDVGKFRAKEKKDRPLRSQKMFSLFERWALKRKATLLVISVMLCALTLFLVPSIKVGTNMLKFFHPSTKLVQDTNLYNKHMSGSGMLTILIDSHTDGDILEPQFLATLEKFAHDIESLDGVGKVQSITPYLKRMNLLMNQDKEPYKEVVSEQADFDFFGGDFGFFGDEPLFEEIYEEPATWDPQTYFEIPTEAAKYGLQTNQDLKNLLSQYLLLYSGNLGLLINDDLEPSSTLITIQMKNTDNGFVRNIRNQIQEYWDDSLPSGWDYAVGGGEAVALALTDLVTTSQIYSLGGALLIVWVLVSFIFRSPIAGLFGLIPVLFALMGIFIFMVLFTIQLDVITSLLAALAIGIGVDYAIHFISACQRLGGKSCEDGGLSVIMRTTGRAIIINAASVTIGLCSMTERAFTTLSTVLELATIPTASLWLNLKAISSLVSLMERGTETHRALSIPISLITHSGLPSANSPNVDSAGIF
jgi:predicted RND superfamily exporter protein